MAWVSSSEFAMPDSRENPRSEPIINLPMPIVATVVLLAAIHLVREHMVSEASNAEIVWWFSFIPIRMLQFHA